jgi:hypothetical protein
MRAVGAMRMRRTSPAWPNRLLALTGLASAVCGGASAQQASPGDQPNGDGSPSRPSTVPAPPANDPLSDFMAHWFERVDEAKASQPQWMTPIATVTPRLEQEFRYDQYWIHRGTGADLTTIDSGKGLELIPTTTTEVLINLPPYDELSHTAKPVSGFGDWPFLTIKQRFISANAQHGDYIVSGFLGFQAPIGAPAFTNNAWVITPTLAAGKGWGNLDVQATVGVPIPLADEKTIGVSIVTNVALQYHLGRFLWPEIEANWTYWTGGLRQGKDQVFITPALILGRFPLVGRSKFIVGAGYQFAVSPQMTTTPVLTPIYRQSWILTARTTF